MKFHCEDAQVACSMVALARRLENDRYEYLPFQEFMCYWVAFNNIYNKIADRAGLKPKIDKESNGTPKIYNHDAGVKIVKVKKIPKERIMIFECAYKQFSTDLKHKLIMHESTRYFVDRKPKWDNSPITTDGFGQNLNGVINVGYTIDRDYPYWCPIDKKLYIQYKNNNNQDDNARDALAKQILEVLYTIRNNIFHAGKRDDDADDIKVVENAVPLLKMIVLDFLNDGEIVGFVNKHTNQLTQS